MPSPFPLKPGFRNVAAITKVLLANGDFLAGIQGNTFFASATGSSTADCTSPQSAGTLTQCLALIAALPDPTMARVYMAPGTYAESVTITKAMQYLTLIGLGNQDSVLIQPSTTNASAVEVRADDVTMVNVRIAGQSTSATYSLRVYGSRFRAWRCTFHSGAAAVIVIRGTAAQVTAATHGIAADAIFEECTFRDTLVGCDVQSSDGGAISRLRFSFCNFYNITTCGIRSNDVAAANACLRGIAVDDCLFDNGETGTPPTDYVLLNTTNDTGRMFRCSFMTTVFAAGTITLASGVLFVDNHAEQEGGLATGGTAGRPD